MSGKRVNRDLTGRQFGYLTVIGQAQDRITSHGRRFYWVCRCTCGNNVIVREDQLMAKNRPTQSCGCMRIEHVREHYAIYGGRIKHGHSRERLFNIWYLMKYRCENPESPAYERYGGRGISVCVEWSDPNTGYEAFKVWSSEHGYSDSLTIDRIDNNGNYCPENCRWISMAEQQSNTSRNVILTYNNKTQTAREWADEIGMPYKTFMNRLYLGWDMDKVFTQPLRKSPIKNSA